MLNKRTARPYRSHRYPACSRCRQSRVRCVVEACGQPCSRCRRQGGSCSLADSRSPVLPNHGFTLRANLADDQSLDYRARMIGPVVARDTHVLDQCISQKDGQPIGMLTKPIQSKGKSYRPIYNVPLPPRIPGPVNCPCTKRLAQQLLDVVEPFLQTLISGYFDQLEPCYPLTDEDYIMKRLQDRRTLPETFLLLLVSCTLYYWDLFPSLALYNRPSQDFAAQVAVTSVAESIHESDLATISALCLGISGRPCRRLVHNAAGVARAVAIAHTIGLNHDCSEWTTRSLEKRMRWKVWWAVLVLDRWYNFAHGTPTYISKRQYDVPLPTMDILLASDRATSRKYVQAAEVYIQLCRLTEILGDILPLIYEIHAGTDASGIATLVAKFSCDLDQWIHNQPDWLDLNNFHERPDVPGLVNLQLSYLSVRMLLRRIAWHETIRTQRDHGSASPSLLQACQIAAEDIVQLVVSLRKQDRIAFWFPYNAQHFTSAVTLLLCCALKTRDCETRAQCMASARLLVDYLRSYHDEHEWDLSEVCLSQSEAALERIEDALPRMRARDAPTSAAKSYTMPDIGSHAGDGDVNNISDERTLELFFADNGEQFSLETLFPEIFIDWPSNHSDTQQEQPVYPLTEG